MIRSCSSLTNRFPALTLSQHDSSRIFSKRSPRRARQSFTSRMFSRWSNSSATASSSSREAGSCLMLLPQNSRLRCSSRIWKASSRNSFSSRTRRALLVNSSRLWRFTMRERAGLFAPTENPVLSLAVQAERFTAGREQSQFEILVRHIFYRFLHNELLTSDDDDTKRVMQISCAIAVPGMIVALFLFPAYHAFPPYPVPRPFWSQAGDHYFYVMYSFVVMGAATVFEWDLLFPDLVDVFVLSVQPIANRHLFFAR